MLDGRRLSLAALLLALGAGCAATHPPPHVEGADPAPPPAQKSLAQRAVARVEEVTGPLGGASDADASSPEKAAHPTAVPIPGSAYVKGRSTVTVEAPIEKVREAVLGFAHYAEFMPHYSKSKLLGRTPTGARDVYMEIEALHGAIKLWAHIELAKPVVVDGVETYNTRFVEGNVKDFQAVWRMKSLGEKQTELSLEVYLEPTIQLPTDLQNEENVNGSANGVLAMKARAEVR